jgi:hypothetical protein
MGFVVAITAILAVMFVATFGIKSFSVPDVAVESRVELSAQPTPTRTALAYLEVDPEFREFDRDYLIAQLDHLPLELRYQIDKARYEAGRPQIWLMYLKPYAYPEETTQSNRRDALLIGKPNDQ